jgi:hypothetical protein
MILRHISLLSVAKWNRCVPDLRETRVGFLENQKRWQCSIRHPKRQFSIKVGTIMEDSPIGIDKWLLMAVR